MSSTGVDRLTPRRESASASATRQVDTACGPVFAGVEIDSRPAVRQALVTEYQPLAGRKLERDHNIAALAWRQQFAQGRAEGSTCSKSISPGIIA